MVGHEGTGSGLMCDMRPAELMRDAGLQSRFIDFQYWLKEAANHAKNESEGSPLQDAQ
jgi:hypothetical protein